MAEAPTDPNSSSTFIKRKIDDAFDALDDALQPRDRPSPTKRANTSIYGSLAKYGIRSFNKPSTSSLTSTPTLSALLSRSRSKKQRKPLPVSQSSKPSSTMPDYSPSSTEAFLERLSTFSLSTYSSKPQQIDAVAAAKAGWINEGGKDRLYCAICKVGWVIAGRDGMNRDAGNALVEKQRISLMEMHKEGCPWRVRQCDPLVYRIPLQSPTGLARQIKSHAVALEPVMDGVSIRHPLSSAQVHSLIQTISSVPDAVPMSSPPSEEENNEHSHLPSTNSILASLFGWSLVPAPPPMPRKSSSASLTAARAHSRAPSVQGGSATSRDGTPAPSVNATATQFNTPIKSCAATFSPGGAMLESPARAGSLDMPRGSLPQKDALLYCRMCQRRVGLWAFATLAAPAPTPASLQQTPRQQRHFDLLREHRSYCPYVVKSTPLPALPSYPSPPTPNAAFNLTRTGTAPSVVDAQPSTAFNLRRTTSLLAGARPPPPPQNGAGHTLVEGWRAVLSVVLRYGMAERSRLRGQPLGSAPTSLPEGGTVVPDEDDAMSGVVALVDGVKQHGGKQLLSYVRSLLG